MAKTNPVFQTASGVLAMFAKSGDPIAQDCFEQMNLADSNAASLVTGNEFAESGGHRVYCLHYSLAIEIRQKAMNQLEMRPAHRSARMRCL